MVGTETNGRNMIRVIVCRPGERAEITEIEETLEAMMEVVGGMIDEYMPFAGEDPREDNIAIICDQESRLRELRLCRAIEDENGQVGEIIGGPFFICYAPLDGESYESLPPDLEEKYFRKFELPERFYRTDGGYKAVRYEPEEDDPDIPFP